MLKLAGDPKSPPNIELKLLWHPQFPLEAIPIKPTPNAVVPRVENSFAKKLPFVITSVTSQMFKNFNLCKVILLLT